MLPLAPVSLAPPAARARRTLSAGLLFLLGQLLVASHAAARAVVPEGFEVTTVASGFSRPVAITFAQDGRMFVAEREGLVHVVQDGVVLPQPFIDLRDEITGGGDRGLLDVALDPQFETNRNVYLLYAVDPVFGEPDEDLTIGSFGRLVRYTGSVEIAGNEADLDSRLVLLGRTPSDGIPVCDSSHSIGSLRFARDSSLFVSAGDGAHFDATDAGGLDPECFVEGMIDPVEDIGAFRAQFLGSLAGKVLRIDPATGRGFPTNPFWTGNGDDAASKIWVSGLRNPYRFTIRPHSPIPGTLYIGDVGWSRFEEIDVARGGENFGWPCFEGMAANAPYLDADPQHSACTTIQTPVNPGPLTMPLAVWHQSDASQSQPPGLTGAAVTGGVFYTAGCYPEPWQDVLFVADYMAQWIKAFEVDAQDQLVAVHDFGTGLQRPVDLRVHPRTGDLYYVALLAGEVRRIHYPAGGPADLNCDGVVTFHDLLNLLSQWGECPASPDACRGDLDADGFVGFADLLFLLSAWET